MSAYVDRSHLTQFCFFSLVTCQHVSFPPLNKSLHFGIGSSLNSSSNEAKQALAVAAINSAECLQFSVRIHLLKLSTTSEEKYNFRHVEFETSAR